jgi:hypothetical protein
MESVVVVGRGAGKTFDVVVLRRDDDDDRSERRDTECDIDMRGDDDDACGDDDDVMPRNIQLEPCTSRSS